MKQLFSSEPLWPNCGLAILRIFIGIFLIYHGKEVFDSAKMNEYAAWDIFKNISFGKLLVYVGKGSEFIAGILFALGIFTRIASVITFVTFIGITFFVGKGQFWSDDQHPFLFALIGLLFFFTGPGSLSFNNILFKKKLL